MTTRRLLVAVMFLCIFTLGGYFLQAEEGKAPEASAQSMTTLQKTFVLPISLDEVIDANRFDTLVNDWAAKNKAVILSRHPFYMPTTVGKKGTSFVMVVEYRAQPVQ